MEKELYDIVMSAIRSNKSRKELERLIDTYLREKGIDGDVNLLFNNPLLAEALKKFDWIKSKSISGERREVSTQILISTAKDFAKQKGKINRAIVDEVFTALRRDVSDKDFSAMIKNRIGASFAVVRTITDTTQQAFSRLDAVSQYEDNVRMKYHGVPTSAMRSHPFCIREMENASSGVTYTKKELRNKVNDFGQKALIYGGGWGCRGHQFIPVEE